MQAPYGQRGTYTHSLVTGPERVEGHFSFCLDAICMAWGNIRYSQSFNKEIYNTVKSHINVLSVY